MSGAPDTGPHPETGSGPNSGQDSLPKPWPRHGAREGANYRIFRSRWDDLENPRTGQRMERVVLETPDWVNVIALTRDTREIVIVRQHRFGSGGPTIEIPGGMIDAGEDPLLAAQRELREETGYVADTWTSLGSVAPNPAFLDNVCYHFLAENAVLDEAQELDAGEDILVATLTAADAVAAIQSGEISHALVITAMSRALDLRLPNVDIRRVDGRERP
ncbi:ADP-ribose pyrophosphatase [Planctomycetes bacterium Poly30]|uniref:GDP-mannose pyrophosphatase n=1 Tax=Saltatorellus ferox TaxID=2528018 RepID=A0A518EVM8_9BACT|nr:ADP-ribose pyrophosphatase [Planctomycetes bacterium Poly30]